MTAPVHLEQLVGMPEALSYVFVAWRNSSLLHSPHSYSPYSSYTEPSVGISSRLSPFCRNVAFNYVTQERVLCCKLANKVSHFVTGLMFRSC
jgi:hypothetical protein